MCGLESNYENITPDQWISNEMEFKERLQNPENWQKIPLISGSCTQNLPNNTLVRFKGMVQDMHNPEFFFEEYEVYNSATNQVKLKSGKYRDTADVLENEKINYASNLTSGQRQAYVVISIPGLNTWAQTIENQLSNLSLSAERPNSTKRLSQDALKFKRPHQDIDQDEEAMDVTESNEGSNKKLAKPAESDASTNNVVSMEHLLNFPLPDSKSKSCIIKIYEEETNLKLNDMIEVVGFLSVDPILSGELRPAADPLIDPEIETDAEILTHNPPPSLVPRLHAVLVKKLDHCNPLVNEEFDQECVLKGANSAREHLLKALTELLLGDQLAAEYLICHLIAAIYLRQDTLTLGQFCLNLSNLPTQKYPNYAKQLYDIIKQFVTKSYYLPLTIDNMNTMALSPKKDYECNRLTSGILQLSKNTHLVLDETKMEQGRLDATGVNNITALGNLIQTQKVEYDFKYYKMEYDSDVSVLILSEGKSLLPNDYFVPLKPEDASLEIFEAIVEAATYYLKEDIMNEIRTYLTNIKRVKYTISDNLQFVEDDFIAMRNESTEESPVTADDLHRLLVLARLVSLSRGRDTLDKECWDITKGMEKERLYRVKNRIASN